MSQLLPTRTLRSVRDNFKKRDLPMQHRSLAAPLVVMLCMLLSGCTTMLTSRPLAPKVSVDSVKAEKISLTRQNLLFRLAVSNPNRFDLPLQTLNFIAAVDGMELAQGLSTERVTIPANGKAMLEVRVSTSINKLLGQLLLATNQNRNDIAYDVKGFVKLSNWPARIPFNMDGALQNPALK